MTENQIPFQDEVNEFCKQLEEALNWVPLKKLVSTNVESTEWDEIKKKGAKHYKGAPIEVIDLLRGVKMHRGITALQAKGLNDMIKYAYRMLVDGVNENDCNKISHYCDMVLFEYKINDKVVELPKSKKDTNSEFNTSVAAI